MGTYSFADYTAKLRQSVGGLFYPQAFQQEIVLPLADLKLMAYVARPLMI
jgi:hypothetical protein